MGNPQGHLRRSEKPNPGNENERGSNSRASTLKRKSSLHVTADSVASSMLTAQQVADLLQVHLKTVYAWKDDPNVGLPCVYLNSAVRFERSDVLAWARAQRKERQYAQA